jgi:SAM-dependent methyltransferase
MVDVLKYAPGLRRGDGGVWFSGAAEEVSFPSTGHSGCYELEDASFWFKHRDAVLLGALGGHPPSGPLFDIGGGNGYVTRTLCDAGYDAVLVEPGPEGVHNARARGLPDVICSGLESAGFATSTLPAIGLFDVLEHVRHEDSFLETVRRVLQPGGRVYITAPAHAWLWSDADIGAQHHRRYTVDSLCSTLSRAGLKVEYSTYFFSFLILPILALRTLPHRLRRGPPRRSLQQRALREHQPAGKVIHAPLQALANLESAAVRRRRRIPIGASCLAVARA